MAFTLIGSLPRSIPPVIMLSHVVNQSRMQGSPSGGTSNLKTPRLGEDTIWLRGGLGKGEIKSIQKVPGSVQNFFNTSNYH